MGKTLRKGLLLLALIVIGLTLISGCGGSSDNNAANNKSASNMDMSEPLNQSESIAAASKADSTSNSGGSQEAAAPAAADGANKAKEEGMIESAADEKTDGGAGFDAGQASADRKVIYHGTVTMEVSDYSKMDSVIRDKAALAGGYILLFSDIDSLYEVGGTYTIKIPAKGFFSFIADLQKTKPLKFQRSVQGEDVSEEYVDLSARLKAKQVVEERLLSFMKLATKTDDLLKFSDQLGNVQEEIEKIKGRMRYLDQNVAFSTLELRVHEQLKQKEDKPQVKKEEKKPVWDRSWHALKTNGQQIGRMLEGLIVFIFGAIPVLLLLAVITFIGLWIYRKYARASTSPKDGGDKPSE